MARPCCIVLSGAGGRLPYLYAVASQIKKALQAKDIEIAAYAGDSAGALVAAWLASDVEFEDLTLFDKKDNLSRHARIGGSICRVISHVYYMLKDGGIISSPNVYKRAIGKPNFFPKPIVSPCYVNAFSITQGKEIVCNLQDFLEPDSWKKFCLGSCCIPGVFTPFPFAEAEYPDYIKEGMPNEHIFDVDLLVDGGVASYLPADFALAVPELRKRDPLIIGVILDNPTPGHNPNVKKEPFHKIVARGCMAAITSNVHEDIEDVHDAGLDLELVYAPTPDKWSDYATQFHYTRTEAIAFYKAGVDKAVELLPGLLKRIEAKLVLGDR